MSAHQKVTIHPYKEGDPMSTITGTKAFARHTALRILSTNGGVNTTTDLDEQICDLFGLKPNEAHLFARTLAFIEKEASADDEAMEAALNALNIGSSLPIALGDRQLILMQKREAEGRNPFGTETLANLEMIESRGFGIIAAMYDMAVDKMAMANRYEELVVVAKAAGNSQAVPANLRRPINVALEKLASARD